MEIPIKSLIRILEGISRTVVVIRHAERPEIKSLKDDYELGITPDGYISAVHLGEELGISQKTRNFQVFSWGSQRVKQTAKAITIGLTKTKTNVVGPNEFDHPTPVINREEYEKAFTLDNRDEYVQLWLSGKNQLAFSPAQKYAKATYQSIIDEKYCSEGKVSIMVTHDLHIMPLIKYVFPSFNSWIEYLDGIVIKDNGDKILVGFDGKVDSILRETLG